jgi:zinc protease
MQRAVNQIEASFLDRLQHIGGFGGIADLLNEYVTETGDPDYFSEDLGRYKAFSPSDIQAVTQTYLRDDNDFVLSIVPKGKQELAAQKKGESK